MIYYFVIKEKTVFLPLRVLYGECFTLIENEPQLSPLLCMHDTCHKNTNCGEILARRVNYFFENVIPTGELLVAYFKYKDKPDSIRAGLFTKNLDEPRVITCNKYAFEKFKKEGIVYSWDPPTEFTCMGSDSNLVLVESMIRDR